jgi:WD40 repeat protein
VKFIRIVLTIVVLQALLACAPATLKAGEGITNGTPDENDAKLKLLYEYHVNDIVDVEFLNLTNSKENPVILLSETTKAQIVNVQNRESIAVQKAPITGFSASQVFNEGEDVLISTNEYIQTWNWRNNKLNKKIQGKGYSQLSGISEDGSTAYFEGALWDAASGNQILKLEEDPSPISFDFSPGGQYFASGGHEYGASIVDIAKREVVNQIDLAGVSKVIFASNNELYTSYGAELVMDLGGYYPHSIGVFTLNNPKPTANFASPNRITCWTLLDNNGLIVALAHKEVRHLNRKLEKTKDWQLPERAFACEADHKNNVYIGSQSGSLYRIDLKTDALAKIKQFKNAIEKLKISNDGNYIAIVTRSPGTSNVAVYHLSP